MNHFSAAWDTVSRNIVQWIVLTVVAVAATILTCGLGGFLVGPNYVLATRRAVVRGVAPEVGDLFETELLVEYLIYGVVMIVLSIMASWIPVVGSLVLGTFTLWTLPLVIDKRFTAIDAFQASFHHAKGAFWDLLVFVLLMYVLSLVGVCACFVGLLVAGPVAGVATWLYYEAQKTEIIAAAIHGGLKPLP